MKLWEVACETKNLNCMSMSVPSHTTIQYAALKCSGTRNWQGKGMQSTGGSSRWQSRTDMEPQRSKSHFDTSHGGWLMVCFWFIIKYIYIYIILFLKKYNLPLLLQSDLWPNCVWYFLMLTSDRGSPGNHFEIWTQINHCCGCYCVSTNGEETCWHVAYINEEFKLKL